MQHVAERPALHQFHREVETAVRCEADVVHGRDAGVLQLARGLRLRDEVRPLVAANGRDGVMRPSFPKRTSDETGNTV